MQFVDQIGRAVEIKFPPRRIISIVPSQTELLFDLGLDEAVVGITKFCIHPRDKFKSTQKVGGTKDLNLQKIRELKPDLIIGNKEENERTQVEELMQEFPVWMSDINNLIDALAMITAVGDITDRRSEAESVSFRILSAFSAVIIPETKKTVAYFIWKGPYMVAGTDTFINDILNRAGYKNFTELSRYPVLTTESIIELKPEIVFLSSEPYPFQEKHIKEISAFLPDSKIMVVDGEMFSWYGSRLLHTPSYIQSLAELINN